MNVCADVFRAYIALATKLLKIFQIEGHLPVRKMKKTIFASFLHQFVTYTLGNRLGTWLIAILSNVCVSVIYVQKSNISPYKKSSDGA